MAGSIEEPQSEEVAVRRVKNGDSEVAVFEFEGKLRDAMVSSLREGHLATGRWVPEARAVSPQGAASLAVVGASAGATALSAAFSSSLFIATANPATLMAIGNGVGSAVMGAGGIIAQAPFIAVASSLPVVAPILAIQALNTAVMMQQFAQVNRKLDVIKSTLDRAIARTEATHAGKLLAASFVVDVVSDQYRLEGSFSSDMLIRLALAERDTAALAARFRQLVDAHGSTRVEDPDEVQQANYDAHSAMLASVLALRVAYLRVCVDMQENPRSVAASTTRLKALIDDDLEFWTYLQRRSSAVKKEIEKLETKLHDMNWVVRNLPGAAGPSVEKELDKRKSAYVATLESEAVVMREFHALVESTRSTRAALERGGSASGGDSPTLVYWKDEDGEHSFVTDQKLLTEGP